MAADDLDRIDQQIKALDEELRRLRDEQQRSSDRSPRLLPEAALARDESGASVQPSRYERSRAFLRRHAISSSTILILAGGLSYGGSVLWNYWHSYETTADARITGFISPISPQIAGTVVKVLVRDDQFVKAGQELVDLDPHTYKLLVDRARAMRDEAKAEADAASYRYQTTPGGRRTAQGANADAKTRAAQKVSTMAQSVVSAKRAAERAAQAALDQALLRLHHTRILAPVAGVVAQRSVNIGQQVEPSERLLAIVQADNLSVTANFKETQLKRIHPGETVTIHVDALGQNYQGQVRSIAPATRSEFSFLPSENVSLNYVKVVQRIAVQISFSPGQDNTRLKPGMSVEPKVWINERRTK